MNDHGHHLPRSSGRCDQTVPGLMMGEWDGGKRRAVVFTRLPAFLLLIFVDNHHVDQASLTNKNAQNPIPLHEVVSFNYRSPSNSEYQLPIRYHSTIIHPLPIISPSFNHHVSIIQPAFTAHKPPITTIECGPSLCQDRASTPSEPRDPRLPQVKGTDPSGGGGHGGGCDGLNTAVSDAVPSKLTDYYYINTNCHYIIHIGPAGQFSLRIALLLSIQ